MLRASEHSNSAAPSATTITLMTDHIVDCFIICFTRSLQHFSTSVAVCNDSDRCLSPRVSVGVISIPDWVKSSLDDNSKHVWKLAMCLFLEKVDPLTSHQCICLRESRFFLYKQQLKERRTEINGVLLYRRRIHPGYVNLLPFIFPSSLSCTVVRYSHTEYS